MVVCIAGEATYVDVTGIAIIKAPRTSHSRNTAITSNWAGIIADGICCGIEWSGITAGVGEQVEGSKHESAIFIGGCEGEVVGTVELGG